MWKQNAELKYYSMKKQKSTIKILRVNMNTHVVCMHNMNNSQQQTSENMQI